MNTQTSSKFNIKLSLNKLNIFSVENSENNNNTCAFECQQKGFKPTETVNENDSHI